MNRNDVIKYNVEDYTIELEIVNVDQIVNIPICDKNGKVLGRALITRQITPKGNNGNMSMSVMNVLMDIIVYDPDDRNKGVADKLMGLITGCDMFPVLFTGISTEAGRSLCLKWGFKQEELKGIKYLVWRKDEAD